MVQGFGWSDLARTAQRLCNREDQSAIVSESWDGLVEGHIQLVFGILGQKQSTDEAVTKTRDGLRPASVTRMGGSNLADIVGRS